MDCLRQKQSEEPPEKQILKESDSLSMFPFEEDEFGPKDAEDPKMSLIHPRSTAVFAWEISLAISSFFNSLLVSFQLSFCFYEWFVFMIGYVFDLNFFIGIILAFLHGILQRGRRARPGALQDPTPLLPHQVPVGRGCYSPA